MPLIPFPYQVFGTPAYYSILVYSTVKPDLRAPAVQDLHLVTCAFIGPLTWRRFSEPVCFPSALWEIVRNIGGSSKKQGAVLPPPGSLVTFPKSRTRTACSTMFPKSGTVNMSCTSDLLPSYQAKVMFDVEVGICAFASTPHQLNSSSVEVWWLSRWSRTYFLVRGECNTKWPTRKTVLEPL